MAAPGHSGRSRLTLIVLALLTVTIITLDLRGFGPLNRAESGIRDGVAPASDAGDSLFSPLTNTWKSFTDFDDLERENEELRAELDALRGQTIRGEAAQETLDDILAELDIEILSGVETVVGRVADPAGNFDDFTIDIDKGERDGLIKGMPVVNRAGLGGKVVAVQRDRAQVELITEQDFGLGIRIIGSGDIALARGQGRGENLEVNEGVEEGAAIDPGMLVVTSGIEGSPFPPDIPVGVVASVTVDDAELQQRLEIQPVVELDRLAFITVILWSVNGPEDDDS